MVQVFFSASGVFFDSEGHCPKKTLPTWPTSKHSVGWVSIGTREGFPLHPKLLAIDVDLTYDLQDVFELPKQVSPLRPTGDYRNERTPVFHHLDRLSRQMRLLHQPQAMSPELGDGNRDHATSLHAMLSL
jgi:hypothetical protein